MICSEIAIKVLAVRECGYFKTNAEFFKQKAEKKPEYFHQEYIETLFRDDITVQQKVEELKERLEREFPSDVGMICFFDKNFPIIHPSAPDGQKPYLLFYRGDINLLQSLNDNVAVIGLVNPTANIEERERRIVEQLIAHKLVIVSGLAKGCDEIAHRVCVENKAKTIAILPSPLNAVYPAENRALADEIVATGGLLITEYYTLPTNRYEATRRFVDRDRLQTMFSKTVILIASYAEGEGDSGSRHAMDWAKKWQVKRFVMFNEKTDNEDKKFGLNRQLVESGVMVVTGKMIKEIADYFEPNLTTPSFEQTSLFG